MATVLGGPAVLRPGSPGVRGTRTGPISGLLRRRWTSILAVAASLAAWEAGTASGILPHTMFPSVSATFARLGGLLVDGRFWYAFGLTVVSWVVGVAIATALALPIGMLLGRSGTAYRSTRLMIDFLRTIPSVSVIPLITLLFGASMEMKVILVIYGSFWPLMLQMVYGVRDTDRVLIDTVRSYRLSRWSAAQHVFAPASLPFVVTGLRISVVVGLLLAVSSEILGSAPGIGLELALAQGGGDLSLTYAYIVFIGLVGLALDLVLNASSRIVLFWHPSVRGGAQ